MTNDTIFALSTAPGRAGVAVVRISGPLSADALRALARGGLPDPRRAAVRRIVDPRTGETIDQALALWFPAPSSFTGEDCAELHVHGGRAVVAATLAALADLPGLRMAEAGEFTRRAFENGRIDMAQVEAIADLVDAETAEQRRQALAGLEGRLGEVVAGWRAEVLRLRGLVAADIDFSDEGDVGHSALTGIDSTLERLHVEMSDVLASAAHGRIVADGLRIAIVGRPNVGKSSLLNALAASDAAIVSEFAGTTRDVIEVKIDLDGYAVVLSDTAGLRHTEDPVERIGISRARQTACEADLVLHLDDGGSWDDWSPQVGQRSIRARTKCDLAPTIGFDSDTVRISTKSGEGLEKLRALIVQHLHSTRPGGSVVVARERQRVAMAGAIACCERARALGTRDVELLDHEIRAMEAALETLIGRIGVEDVLGEVFARFCVGK